MKNQFYTNYTEEKFIDKLKHNIDTCNEFFFSVSFIKKAGLGLISNNIEAALNRGAKGKVITSTYQNFTDVDSLVYFLNLTNKYPNNFSCHLDKNCFHDVNGNEVGFHTKGYLFEFNDHKELLIGSSNITVYALLKNIEWDVSIIEDEHNVTYDAAKNEFEYLWKKTSPLSKELIDDYRVKVLYSIERWDMDYDLANNEYKPNYMQKRALRELNRFRVTGVTKALIVASAGSGKTFLAAFDALNFNPRRLLYVVKEGSILMKSFETFQIVFGSDKTYGIYNKDYKEFDADFVFSTNITMCNNLALFDKHDFDYIIIDECHHSTAESYKKIINYFEPQFLLGLTATPERMDGEDVFGLFDENVPYELRLRDAIINGLVVPFEYYGIRDELIEYGVEETKGHKFVEQFSDEKHIQFICDMIEKYREPGKKLKALAFCRDVSHAIRMKEAMEDYYHTAYLTGRNSTGERIRTYNELQDDDGQVEILFTVDILNEGVDIPGVNMVLFLRPTESSTIFIQQLGRGLRKYKDKKSVTVLDFIGNDYKRSVQIGFAIGNLSENFVMEKQLLSSLIRDDFTSLGLKDYGVQIHIDDLSKKEILKYLDNINFNTRQYLEQDYRNFKKYLNSPTYPKHIDYLNNDYAPDLMKFLQSKISNKKNRSYYGFLKAINEDDLPSFSDRQVDFINYLSDMLPIVRPYEYLIVQCLIRHAGKVNNEELVTYIRNNVEDYDEKQLNHALEYMDNEGFVVNSGNTVAFHNVSLNTELTEYLNDLLDYGLEKYIIDFSDKKELFKVWGKYRKEQVQQLLLKNPGDIMLGTKVYDNTVYAYVTVIKKTSETLNYADGYIDESLFQWETVNNITTAQLNELKSCKTMHIFVRKVSNENGIQLPFTYIGHGSMEYIENSRKSNGAHLFHVHMDEKAPEDMFYDFKLPNL